MKKILYYILIVLGINCTPTYTLVFTNYNDVQLLKDSKVRVVHVDSCIKYEKTYYTVRYK
jgi:hypothetical protein